MELVSLPRVEVSRFVTVTDQVLVGIWPGTGYVFLFVNKLTGSWPDPHTEKILPGDWANEEWSQFQRINMHKSYKILVKLYDLFR